MKRGEGPVISEGAGERNPVESIDKVCHRRSFVISLRSFVGSFILCSFLRSVLHQILPALCIRSFKSALNDSSAVSIVRELQAAELLRQLMTRVDRATAVSGDMLELQSGTALGSRPRSGQVRGRKH